MRPVDIRCQAHPQERRGVSVMTVGKSVNADWF